MKRRTFLRSGAVVLAGVPFAGKIPWMEQPLTGTSDGAGCLTLSSIQTVPWVKLGGPIGGLGYNIRYRTDTPNVMFVTDAWSGLQRSLDGGATWLGANFGLEGRSGASDDAIPVFAFRIDPNDPSIMWAGMEAGLGVYRSTDGGNTWHQRDNGIDLHGLDGSDFLTIRHIEVASGNSESVFVMGEKHTGVWGNEFERVQGFVYHSVDGGASFTLQQTFQSLTRWLFISPNDTSEMLLTTGIFDREADTDDPGQHSSGPGLGVYRSSDGGLTWNTSNEGMNTGKSLFVGGADRHPQDTGTFIVATGNNNDFNRGVYGAVYRSINGGQSWADVTPAVGPLVYREPFTAVAFSPSNPDVVYVGSADAIYRSVNGGLTWVRHAGAGGAPYGPPGVRSGVPIDMVVSPDDPDTLYVNNYGGGVFRSNDGARTWIDWSQGYTGADIHGIAAGPNDRVAANGRSGVFVSADKGNSWQGMSNGPAAFPEGFGAAFDPSDPTGQTLLVSDEHQGLILRTTNGGSSWTEVLSLGVGGVGDRHGARKIRFAPSDPSIVYAGFMAADLHPNPHDLSFPASLGVYRSTDGGITWAARNSGLAVGNRSRNVTDISVSSTDPDVVYLTLRDGGVYRTDDGGGSWTSAMGTLPGSQTWDDVWADHDPIPRHAMLSVLAFPGVHDSVLIGTHMFGVYKSVDGGASWQHVCPAETLIANGTRDHGHVFSLAVDGGGVCSLFAFADWHGGVYLSADHGESWQMHNDGLSTRSVAALEFSGSSGYLYAATQGEGVFRLSPEVISPATERNQVPDVFELMEAFPNPSGRAVTVRFTLRYPSEVSVELFDAVGRRVRNILREESLTLGIHELTIQTEGMASGVYSLRFLAGGHVRTHQISILR